MATNFTFGKVPLHSPVSTQGQAQGQAQGNDRLARLREQLKQANEGNPNQGKEENKVMNQNETIGNNNGNAGNQLSATQFEAEFRFRRIKESDLAGIINSSEQDAQVIQNCFVVEQEKNESGEYINTGFIRRKPERHVLEMPAFVLSIPEDHRPLAELVVQRTIEEFVKTEYIDNFLPVGDHDWTTIQTKALASGRRSSFTIDEELYAAAIKTIVDYIVQATQAKQIANPMTKALEGKFTRASIQRNIGRVDEKVINSLKNHLDGWAAHIAEENPELANDYAEVYSYLHNRLDNLLNSDQKLNIADML